MKQQSLWKLLSGLKAFFSYLQFRMSSYMLTRISFKQNRAWILPSVPPVELLHLLCRTRARDAMVALGTMAWPLPSCGPVDMIDIEDPAMAVNTSFPVWGNREGRESRQPNLNPVVGSGTPSTKLDWNTDVPKHHKLWRQPTKKALVHYHYLTTLDWELCNI